MTDFLNISDFLSPVNVHDLLNSDYLKNGQLGKTIQVYDEQFPDLDEADIVLVGCGEQRGSDSHKDYGYAADNIRKYFYSLYYWHLDMRMADIGNVSNGSSLADSYAALKTVVHELINEGKTVIILGGSHDLTLAQYGAYADNQKAIEACGVDALIDLNIDS